MKKAVNSQITLEQKNKIGELTLPDFKAFHKATVTKTVVYWCQNEQIDQQIRTGNPEIDPHIYGQLVFSTGAKTIKWREIHLLYK